MSRPRDHIGESPGPPGGGPSIIVPGLWSSSGNPGHPLTAEERAILTVIATVVRFKKRETIYREGEPAAFMFNIINGVIKSYRILADGTEYVVGFLFANDLVGLALEGTYINSAEAVTPVTLYRIPTKALEARLRKHPGLDFQIIAKLCYDLRESQRHAFLTSRHRTVAKMGLFLQMLETIQAHQEASNGEVYLPMSRSDIASFAGISLEAVSRAFRDLVQAGAISLRNHRHVQIMDREKLESAISGSGSAKTIEARG